MTPRKINNTAKIKVIIDFHKMGGMKNHKQTKPTKMDKMVFLKLNEISSMKIRKANLGHQVVKISAINILSKMKIIRIWNQMKKFNNHPQVIQEVISKMEEKR